MVTPHPNQPAPSVLAPRLGGLQPIVTGREPELSGARKAIPPLIVHVDDESSLTELIGFVIEATSAFRHVGLTDGQETIDFCRASPPAMVVTDLLRPGVGGKDMIQIFRADSCLAHIPILIVSANCLTPFGSDRVLLDYPQVFHVTKPFSPSELMASIGNILGWQHIHPDVATRWAEEQQRNREFLESIRAHARHSHMARANT